MLEALMKIFGKNEKSSRQVARERLQVVLIHDRARIAPEVMEHLRDDMIRVISNYVDINKKEMEISLANDDNSVALVVNIPVNRVKRGGVS